MKRQIVLFMVVAVLIVSCRGGEMQTVQKVDIEKFMGDWYVIAIIPNFIEKHAINGIESYELLDEERVKIDYRFTDQRSGKVKHMQPNAWIYDKESNAEWRVQFFWPIKYPYLIIDLAEDYSYTVIGVPNRKFVWIMARESQIPEDTYEKILLNLKETGYDIAKIKKMPQVWE